MPRSAGSRARCPPGIRFRHDEAGRGAVDLREDENLIDDG